MIKNVVFIIAFFFIFSCKSNIEYIHEKYSAYQNQQSITQNREELYEKTFYGVIKNTDENK